MNPIAVVPAYARWLGWLVAQLLRAIADRLNPPPPPPPKPRPFRCTVKPAPRDTGARFLVILEPNSPGYFDIYSAPTPENPSGHRQLALLDGDISCCLIDQVGVVERPPSDLLDLVRRRVH